MFEQEVIANTVAHMWDTFQPTLITAIVVFGVVKVINYLRSIK
jgi:hypothetical protein